MAGGARYDLNGEPCGEVTEAAVKHATESLKALERKYRVNRNRVINDKEEGKQETESAADGR